MSTIPDTPTESKPHRSREAIDREAACLISNALVDASDNMQTAAAIAILAKVYLIVMDAHSEANTCEVCGWLGHKADPVIEVTERVHTGVYRSFRQCKFIPACADRQKPEVRA